MADSNNTANVSTTRGIKGGYAFNAPIGTTLPTDLKTALDTAFENAGFISSDGWKEGLDSSSDNIQDMNGDNVDSYASSNTETLAMTLIEMGKNALSVQYGHENVTEKDGVLTVDHNWGNAEENRSWVLELVLKNGRRWRKVIPSAKLTELGEFQGNATTAAGREVTLTYQVDENGSTCKDYIESLADNTAETVASEPVAQSMEPDLDAMTKEQLITYATEHEIDVTGASTKAEILALIHAAEVSA